ncbi:hypothetical protein GW820_07230 [archaeon]|nr:hypothetical protein [archaeon]
MGKEVHEVDLNKEKEPVKKDSDDDLDKVDSDEERIIQTEIKRRREESERLYEKEKKDEDTKKIKPYGQYKEIVESDFLDTMLKHNQVVCHFYSPEFERCKIADKHLSIISQQHAETFFVKINALKTPFFTTKLNVQVRKFFNVLDFTHYCII